MQIFVVMSSASIDSEFRWAEKLSSTGHPSNTNEKYTSVLTSSLTHAAGMHATVDKENSSLLQSTPGLLLICVSDHGQGMSQTEANALFKPFARVRRGHTAQGTGFGLWLMRKLLHSQGGALRVFSKGVEQGCTFIVGILVLQVKRKHPASRNNSWQRAQMWANTTSTAIASAVSSTSWAPASGKRNIRLAEAHSPSTETDSKTGEYFASMINAAQDAALKFSVLVVDDSVPIRRMMARCLRNAGMHVLTADNGRRP